MRPQQQPGTNYTKIICRVTALAAALGFSILLTVAFVRLSRLITWIGAAFVFIIRSPPGRSTA